MGATKRLSKVAREFNQSIGEIVQFLSDKGFTLESNPNEKINSEMYDFLVGEFHADKVVREESKNASVDLASKETISIDPQKISSGGKSRDDGQEIIIKNIENVTTLKAKAPKPKDLSVVGKIDLDELKPKKKQPEPVVEKDQSSEVKKEERPVEPQVKKEVKTPKKEEPETIKAVSEKLTGPKVLSKIELPVEKKRTPSSERKKRKRIVKDGKVNPSTEKRSNNQRHSPRGPHRKAELTEEEIQKQVRETLARLSSKGKSKGSKHRKAKREADRQQFEEEMQQQALEKKILKVTEFVTANELASMMDVSVNQVISACMSLGLFVSINQRLDAETISIVVEEFGFNVEFTSAEVLESIVLEEDKEEDLVARPPIVTVMGHVDHGKTSLLDYIRKANVIEGEAGGITQHIGSYSVNFNDKKITFLDTPGHEAFTAMRARGAQVTDIAIIVIAADDSVMPQTKEAINHAQAAGVPMIFALNKIDKEGANPDKVREELSTMNILVEEWGGKFQAQEISAKHGKNIDELLEKVLLEAEMLELKANPNKLALGTIIESSLDKGRGHVANILVQAGTLKVGDMMVAGSYSGKVKAMFNENGEQIKSSGPSSPVSILGLDGAPSAGDKFNVLKDEKEAKSIATKRQQLLREQGIRAQKHITLDEIGRRLAIGDFQELNVIIKGDVDGSIEALADSLLKLSTEKIQVNVIHKSVGQISDSDVLLATASDAIIIGFQVRPSATARKLAEKEQIDIRLYSVIYNAIEELTSAMEGMLAPTIEEKVVCNIEVREVFKISKVGTIAGCFVTDGKVSRNTKVRLIRDGIVVYTGELGSLKRFKDDVKEVSKGYECGLNIKNYNDVKVDDVIEGYEEVEVKTKLN